MREVTLEQPADGRVRVRIVPHDRRLWGWRVEQTSSELRITLRAAPAIATDAPSPLAPMRLPQPRQSRWRPRPNENTRTAVSFFSHIHMMIIIQNNTNQPNETPATQRSKEAT